MAVKKGMSVQPQGSWQISVAPRQLRAGDTWFEPSWGASFRDTILALILNGELPDWPAVIPPELRVSRKLGFRVRDQIVVIAGVGLVQRDRGTISLSTPQVDMRAFESVTIHDSYISQLDLKRDPLGGLSIETMHLALTRMASARESAGSMGIIPKVLAHGAMRIKAREMGFLVYAYPAYVKKPSAWLANTDEFGRGMENMARFLASLHRQLFHGGFCRPDGFANTLWTTDGQVIPVVTGWGQHAGLFSSEMVARDVSDLIEAGFCQLAVQKTPDGQVLSLNLARRVLAAYGQMKAAFKLQEYDFQHDPLEGIQDGLDVLADEGRLVQEYIARFR